MIEKIKFIFYLIPILGLYINILDNIFIEKIKSEYSYIPGKFSYYGKVINFLINISICISVIFLFIFPYIILKDNHKKIVPLSDLKQFIWICFFIIFTLTLYMNVMLTLLKYFDIKTKFKILLGDIENKGKHKNKIFHKVLYVMNKYYECLSKVFSFLKLNKLYELLYNFLYRYNEQFSYTISAINIYAILYIFLIKSDIYVLEVKFFILYSFFINISVSIINSSLRKILNEINSNKKYIFIFENNESIITNIYLDYKNDYMIIKSGQEIFIPKSSIKRKIVKYIKNKNIVNYGVIND